MTQEMNGMEERKTDFVYSEYVFIHVGDALSDFMEQFKTIYRYDKYDQFYISNVLLNLSPAFIYRPNFEFVLQQTMGNFTDTSLIYSDETYDPSKTIRAARELATKIFETLQINGAYVQDMFPYDFYGITPALAVIFKHNPFYCKPLH